MKLDASARVKLDASASMADLLGHLTRTTSDLHRSEVELRRPQGSALTRREDLFSASWHPPPSRERIKAALAGMKSNTYVRFVKNAGGAFYDNPGYLKPKHLEVIPAARAMMPERSYAKLPSQIRYHAHSDPFPEPKDSMCTELHIRWLKKHQRQRDSHVHHIFHALEKVDKAKERYEAHARQRELTRDIVSRAKTEQDPEGPKLSSKMKLGLAKVLTSVSAGRLLTKISGGVDKLAEAEAKDKAAFEKTQSAPCLVVAPPLPATAVKHLRSWKGTEMPLRYLRTSTPWREADEIRAMTAKGLFKTAALR